MARPLSTSDQYRGGYNGNYQPRYSLDDGPQGDSQELDQLRAENAQLHALRAELEHALVEATQQAPDVSAYEERLREYEVLLEEKSETIRQLHVQLEEASAALVEQAQRPGARPAGPLPREDELLTLSEDLERERRQLQEDEATLMEQMRQMEISMARERAEMARQRNDLQRLHGEIRHELERLERNGALQNKMEELKAKLQDAATRRGAAPANPAAAKPPSSSALPSVNHQQSGQSSPPAGRNSFMGRLFGK